LNSNLEAGVANLLLSGSDRASLRSVGTVEGRADTLWMQFLGMKFHHKIGFVGRPPFLPFDRLFVCKMLTR
jgi:hypothetical protein